MGRAVRRSGFGGESSARGQPQPPGSRVWKSPGWGVGSEQGEGSSGPSLGAGGCESHFCVSPEHF